MPQPRRRDPLLDRAMLETDLKLGPQANALRSLLSELAGSYSRERSVNNSNAKGIIAATRQARPEVGAAFEQALGSSGAQRAALGVGTGDAQGQAFSRRVGEQRANALGDLTQRELGATEGRVFANNSARSEYMGGKQKILGQMQELAGQSGALTAATLGTLEDKRSARGLQRRGQDVTARNAAGSRAQQERNSIRSSGVDPNTGRPIPGGRLDPKAKKGSGKPSINGVPVLSQSEHNRAKDAIDGAQRWIQNLSQSKMSSSEIRSLLATGGEIDVGQASPLKVPKFSKDFVNSAYDLLAPDAGGRGGLSRANVQALHKRGLRIKTLGYALAPRGPRQGPRTGTLPDNGLPTLLRPLG